MMEDWSYIIIGLRDFGQLSDLKPKEIISKIT